MVGQFKLEVGIAQKFFNWLTEVKQLMVPISNLNLDHNYFSWSQFLQISWGVV